MSKKFKEKLVNYFIKHYTHKGHCSLCGNSGIIDTTGITTQAGVPVGRKNHCICPNGLAWKKAERKVRKTPTYSHPEQNHATKSTT
jgi:hypothetical protein